MFLAASVALVYFVCRSQLFAATLVLLMFLLTDAIRDQFSLSVTVSGFRVSAVDIFCTVLIVIAAFRSVTVGVDNALLGIGWALALLLVFHAARGVADFGFQTAVNSVRPWLYFLAPLLFASTVPVPWGNRVWRLIACTGLVLVVVSVPYFFADGIHPASRLVVRNGHLISDRPVTASGALVILMTVVLLLASRRLSPRARIFWAAVAVADIIALEQRTVWVASLAIGLVGFVAWSRRRLPQDERLVSGATGVLLITAPIALFGFFADKSFRASLAETTAKNSTFSWRTQSWQELVSSHHSALDIASGGPAGASWARAVNGILVTQAPHDAFVEAFLRFGVPGVALFGGLLIALWSRRTALGASNVLPASAVGLILIAQVVFSVTYTLGPVQGLILGIFISTLSLERAKARYRVPARGQDGRAGHIAMGHQ
ncbi:MAG TPA: O-antigen ligase family protein [Gaiellaceae bacterium]|nr:O-antigen ligase family protein [Gaiellaceae bacterium]